MLLLAAAIAVLPEAAALAQPEAVAADPLQQIPVPGPITIQPRLFSAYGALIAAAMLSLLYVYRGRAFIVYWIGSWLLMAAALGLVARGYADPLLDRVLTGLSLLFVVWSSGLMLLGARAFPQNALHWSAALKGLALSSVWFLVAPFAVPPRVLVLTGTVVTAALLGWAAVRYLQLARRSRYAGAVLIGAGLALVCVGNLAGTGVALTLPGAEAALARLAAINVVTSMFIALGMHLLVFEDMTDELRLANRRLGAANEEVKRLAITDPLTGCHNRRFFDEIERREMHRHQRYGAPLSVVFVDVDHFKRLNDRFGHDRGDEALRILGALLHRQVRESDYVIRWGGDEFLLLLACGAAEARTKAGELKAAFARERAAAGLPGDLGLSIGVAAVSRDPDALRTAIREADAGMYRDKLSARTPLTGSG